MNSKLTNNYQLNTIISPTCIRMYIHKTLQHLINLTEVNVQKVTFPSVAAIFILNKRMQQYIRLQALAKHKFHVQELKKHLI